MLALLLMGCSSLFVLSQHLDITVMELSLIVPSALYTQCIETSINEVSFLKYILKYLHTVGCFFPNILGCFFALVISQDFCGHPATDVGAATQLLRRHCVQCSSTKVSFFGDT